MSYASGKLKDIDQDFWTELDRKLGTKVGYSRAHFTSIYNRWGPKLAVDEVIVYARELAYQLGPNVKPQVLMSAVVDRYPEVACNRKIRAKVRAVGQTQV